MYCQRMEDRRVAGQLKLVKQRRKGENGFEQYSFVTIQGSELT